MKKNKIYILVASAALLALAGCAKDPGPGNGGEITVEASIGATKVSTVGDDSAFEANDRIAVYAWTGGATAVPDSRVVDGVVNTLGSDGKWTPATKMIWGSMTTPHFFLGISPVPAAISDFTAASFTLDPSPAAYVTSDLLVATNFGTGNAGLTAADGAVPLVFDHVMAKLNVNLKFRSEWDTTPSVSSVTVTAKTAATVNYLTKTATADATAAAGEVPLNALETPATGYRRSYSSLQVPQAFHKITITIAGKEYVFQSTDDIVLAGGRYTTVNLIVGRDQIQLGDISISSWASDGVDRPVAELQPVPDVLDLSTLTADTKIEKDITLTGTTTYKLTLADDVKVTLSGVNITNTDSPIKCEGDATVILADGTDNVLKTYNPGYASNPALWAGPTGTTLTIDGTGSLTATGGMFSASIGGPRKGTCGNITIKGGTINAYGSNSGAGIGSGNLSSCGDIIISGGTVTANGGDSSAGIGSGYKESKCGVITISGGTIIANGGDRGPGIGSGYSQSECENIIISGGSITAKAGEKAAGIGSGSASSKCGAITISGGTVIANGGENAAGIGSGYNYSSCGDIAISGGVVMAVKGDGAPNSIGAGKTSTCGSVTIGGKEGAKSENFAIAFLGSLTKDLSVETDMTLTGTTSHSVTIADGKTVTLDGVYIYIVTDTGRAVGIRCLGDATIVLADGSENTLDTEGTALCPGPDGKTLTIEGDTGKLVAKASNSYCAIGCSEEQPVIGNIVINGGIIEAYGGKDSAAIGSGHGNACGDIAINGGDVTAMAGFSGAAIGAGEDGTCGNIEITDGKVKATGGAHATGIGTGRGNSLCGSITITGGTVEAYGGYECPAIGCAEYATGNGITINGGSGTAYAGESCSYSIGSYDGGDSCGFVTIDHHYTGSINQSPYSWNL